MQQYVYKTLLRAFIVKNTGETMRLINKIINNYTAANEDHLLGEFIDHLNTLNHKPDEKAGAYKVKYITDTIDITPANVLDIGAGSGDILGAVGETYSIGKDKLFALDLQPITSDKVTVIGYDADMRIPLDDKSVDLIIMLSLLHHISPEGRQVLLAEVQRVLSPDGRVIIREHNDPKSPKFRIFLQLIHYIWYVRNAESHDPLFLMSRKETQELMNSADFTAHKYVNPGQNIQQLYCEIYKNKD
jgi:ubiquinone/menaquinone biosynthesis C-methylase UbiE